MRDGESDICDPQMPGDLRGAAVKTNGGAPSGLANNFDLQPTHAPAYAGSERLCTGLLCGEASGKTLCGISLAEAVGLFGGCIDAIEESLAEAIRGLLNPGDLNQVNAAADDHAMYQATTLPEMEIASCHAIWTAFGHLNLGCRTADNLAVRPETTPRSVLRSGPVPWVLEMRAISQEEPSRLVKTVTGAILGCGGWVLSRSAADSGLIEMLFEFERQSCLEIYTALVASGLEFGRAAHLRLTELC